MTDNNLTNPPAVIVSKNQVEIFNGLPVLILTLGEGNMYMPIKQLAGHFVAKPDNQVTLVKSDARFNYIDIEIIQKEGQRQVKRLTACLPIEEIAAFIYGLNINKVYPELRPNLLNFQRLTIQAIDNFWRKGIAFGEKAAPKPPKSLKYILKEFRAAKSLAKECGLEGNHALLASNKLLERCEDFNVLDELGIQHLTAKVQESEFNATTVGEMANLPGKGRTKGINMMLAAWHLGLVETYLDHKNKPLWRLLEKGKAYAHYSDVQKPNGQRTSVQQIMWHESVVPLIKDCSLSLQDFAKLKAKRREKQLSLVG